ncbi:TPA: hypothetical protein BOS_15709 [Bos taurus]|nr:TPA: hypothetical protein BOS_15709 [Bos taurus]
MGAGAGSSVLGERRGCDLLPRGWQKGRGGLASSATTASRPREAREIRMSKNSEKLPPRRSTEGGPGFVPGGGAEGSENARVTWLPVGTSPLQPRGTRARGKGAGGGLWAVKPGRAAEDASRRSNPPRLPSRRDSASPSHRSEPGGRPPVPGATRCGRAPGGPLSRRRSPRKNTHRKPPNGELTAASVSGDASFGDPVEEFQPSAGSTQQGVLCGGGFRELSPPALGHTQSTLLLFAFPPLRFPWGLGVLSVKHMLSPQLGWANPASCLHFWLQKACQAALCKSLEQ